MSFTTITVILLGICLGATGTTLGVPEEPTQDGRAAVPQALTITDVRWRSTGTTYTVQICTAEELPDGVLTLAYIDGTNDDVTLDGVIEQVTPPKCANFSVAPYKYTENPSRYELVVADLSDPPSFLGRGFTTFAITVRTTLLTCDDSGITKITWSAGEKLPDIDCLKQPLGLVKACYHNKDLTDTEFCFTVNDGVSDVNVCLNGALDASPSTGTVSMNYFYYGATAFDSEPASATLSLAMDTTGLNELRAIVRLADDPESSGTPGEATVHKCSGTECTFVGYTRKFATHEVCVEAIDANSETMGTATTSFKDLNLNVFDGGSQKSMLLESVFANGLEGMKYTATLYQEAPPDIVPGSTIVLDTATLDCTSVADGHACFGFLDTSTGTDIVHQTLSAMDGSNTIIVPFKIP